MSKSNSEPEFKSDVEEHVNLIGNKIEEMVDPWIFRQSKILSSKVLPSRFQALKLQNRFSALQNNEPEIIETPNNEEQNN